MRRVFTDSSFWIALRSVRDENHKAAKLLASRLMRERRRLVVTPLIFAEVHARFCRSPALREQVIRDIPENPVVEWEPLEHADYQSAIELTRSRADKDYSFCDATCFVLMERLGIELAVSFDGHFSQTGRFDLLE